ncbi:MULTISPECIES: DUF1376 domain-containing protein [unclassified Sinorhizobium]|uniref:DUF1376 domain-containing protein n=1 Tax=unclassified Sinorhizobium TaxID=2613772 RepID=UPI0024C38F6C|nr:MULTISPECIES: DUF1376 domain-containing protein [unclassified Sinorhizobium]MDK1377117.1 DUF1376 domain-containing protein [Sinorhizobium sp. 6-70]MDK1479588.1 DUF1376 domain-containing protein [Sinorhizobium sp. 6-117]
MSNGKARRVDYHPDEYIAGVGGVLRADEQGVYWMLCSLIMSEGHAIEQNERRISALCGIRPSDVRRIIEKLVTTGKISRQSDGKLFQKRAQSEVEKSLKRIQTASENGSNGGRPSKKNKLNQRNEQEGGFSNEKLTTNHQPPTTNHQPILEEDKSSSFGQSIEDEFENSFWPRYPRKAAKGAALRAFKAVRKKHELARILEGADRYASERKGQDPKYTKQPASWLNGLCWLDEPSSQTVVSDDWRSDPVYAGVE